VTITIMPTNQFVVIEGLLTRRWNGVTDEGTSCHLFIASIRVPPGEDNADFLRELRELPQPEGDPIPYGEMRYRP
jgi:hypothetical protein